MSKEDIASNPFLGAPFQLGRLEEEHLETSSLLPPKSGNSSLALVACTGGLGGLDLDLFPWFMCTKTCCFLFFPSPGFQGLLPLPELLSFSAVQDQIVELS